MDNAKDAPNHVFIDQYRDMIPARGLAAQARRLQAAEKRRLQRHSARTRATYARSLVGWRIKSAHDPEQNPSAPRSQKSAEILVSCPSRFREVHAEHPVYDTINSGLRLDPFSAFPSTNSKDVMFMVDYHIHVWCPHKAGNFDALMGYNTQVDICWPIALQNDMLFDATVAVYRAALVLHDNLLPTSDRTVLHHQGLALNRMRQRFALISATTDVALIFTVGRMLSIAYMAGDLEAFEMHFIAFRAIARPYVFNFSDQIARVIQNRLDSWQALHDYRAGSPCSTFTCVKIDRSGRTSLSPVLSEEIKLCLSLADVSSKETDCTILQLIVIEFENRQRTLKNALTHVSCTPEELRYSIAVIAFCAWKQEQIHDRTQHSGSISESEEDARWWRGAGQTYINLTSNSSNTCSPILSWSSLVLGSFLLQKEQQCLKRKGHIILIELLLKLNDASWSNLITQVNRGMGALWDHMLVQYWGSSWQNAAERHHEWRALGTWKLGMPKTQDLGRGGPPHTTGARIEDCNGNLVEYLLLRDARDSLPLIA